MANSSVNAVQLIRRQLLSSTELTTQISGRVFTSHFLDVDNQTIPMPLVIVDNQGGSGNYGMGTQKLEIDIYVYSKISSTESDEIYHRVYQTLHGARLADTTTSAGITEKGWIYEQERPSSGFNAEIKGWFKRATYVLFTAG